MRYHAINREFEFFSVEYILIATVSKRNSFFICTLENYSLDAPSRKMLIAKIDNQAERLVHYLHVC